MAREVTRVYRDPLDELWLACAAEVGLRVRRTADAYASTDGRGTLSISTPEHLDADDCLAQMVFHELCHALVQGPDMQGLPDWGLDNVGDGDVPREHACLRAQAALAEPYGLRDVLAPTTDFRQFYDQLGPDPLAPADDPAVVLARAALVRAEARPWAPALQRALEATATIVEAVAAVASESLFAVAGPRWPAHPSGRGFVAPYGQGTCGECAWSFPGGDDGLRCRRGEVPAVEATWPACEGWEPDFDCQHCGACCREAYGSVTIERDEPFIVRHPDLVVDRGDYVEIRRAGPRCIALEGGPTHSLERFDPAAAYRCTVYDDRPTPCRDLERAGEHCLTARRRVGLSR